MNELPLKDIHLPELSLWWPPAPGWWLVMVLMALLIFYSPRLLRWMRWKPVKSISLRELARIRAAMQNGLDEQRTSQEISILLRRTVISYSGRAIGASVTGESWIEALNSLAGHECFTAEQNEWLRIGRFAPAARCDLEAMLHSCENWIRSLPRRNPDAAA
jgi:hypothetical protein